MRKSREELDRMGREELEEILCLDSQGVGEYSTEDVFYILDVLDRREKEAGEYHVEVDRAWQVFQQDHLVPRKDKKRWWLPRGLGATAAALVLVFVGLLTARAAGGDGGMTLQELLDGYGVTQVTAPTWLPQGCQGQTTERIFTLDGVCYELKTTYAYQGKSMVLDISNADRPQTPEGGVEITDMDGQSVYILDSGNQFAVVWSNEQVECCLVGPEQEILVKVAKSMLN